MSIAAIADHCAVSIPTVAVILRAPVRQPWSAAERAEVRRLYPTHKAADIAQALHRPVGAVYAEALKLGVAKDPAYLAAELGRQGDGLRAAGAAHRFPKGHVPANRGLRRPGYVRGRMAETQFKKGGFPVNRDPAFYVPGALRVIRDKTGREYIEMRTSFAPGGKGWTGLHRVLWEDAHGPIPPGHLVVFKNRDSLDVELSNLELITYAENMRRNTIHNLPAPLKLAVMTLGQLKRRINERRGKHQHQPGKDSRGSADVSVRDAAGPA